MKKQAIVRFSIDQFDDDDEPETPLQELPMSFQGEFMGMKDRRIHVHLNPELDKAFLEKKASILISQSFNKEYRGVYVGDDDDGNAVFDQINQVR